MTSTAPKQQVENFPDKKQATVEEISQQWDSKYPLETGISIIHRLKTGQFKFNLPKEIQEFGKNKDEKISLGAEFVLNDFSFLYKIEDLICKRCEWFIKNGKEYQQPNYDGLFASLSAAKLDLTTMSGSLEFTAWQSIITNIQPIILPPEMIAPKPELEAMTELMLGEYNAEEKKKIDELSADEISLMQIALAKHLYLSKEVFFHWLRLGFHKLTPYSSRNNQGYYKLPEYNKFWGNEWSGEPKCWDVEKDEEHGLILEQSFKYYSDPHEWAGYESALKAASQSGLITEVQKAGKKVDELKAQLLNRFIAMFNPLRGLLKAQGYTDKAEPVEITYSQLKAMQESKKLNIEDSFGKIGQVEFQQITILKANAPTPKAQPVKANKYNLGTAETKTLFKLIAGMAKVGYSYDEEQSRNEATADIVKDTGVDHKTAKKWIEIAIEQTQDKTES